MRETAAAACAAAAAAAAAGAATDEAPEVTTAVAIPSGATAAAPAVAAAAAAVVVTTAAAPATISTPLAARVAGGMAASAPLHWKVLLPSARHVYGGEPPASCDKTPHLQRDQVMALNQRPRAHPAQGECTLDGSGGRTRPRRRSCVEGCIAAPHKSQLAQWTLQSIFCCQVGVVEQRNQGSVTQRMLIKPLPMQLTHTLFQLSHANLTGRGGQ
eukprot:CAMPEP_0204129304 /NCGR_PEP_ID=MMETSP0361-20130328/12694_1 /ASSEMBLY_ACC=CAM_ASM_000343 /TAXON_ID=268821 /ORGANISM="Scrippsiella Hangoei, Strain SHTV-5" /LENGTH=213 /DNA_ID=CAMNT_0051081689 /DNA_START=364 /DNA_END=1006 /DNA_ORIENTATION=-